MNLTYSNRVAAAKTVETVKVVETIEGAAPLGKFRYQGVPTTLVVLLERATINGNKFGWEIKTWNLLGHRLNPDGSRGHAIRWDAGDLDGWDNEFYPRVEEILMSWRASGD